MGVKMSDDEKDETVQTITPLTPTKFIKVTCSSCGYPILCQSDAAFHAAREDHLNAVHRVAYAIRLSQALGVDDPEENA